MLHMDPYGLVQRRSDPRDHMGRRWMADALGHVRVLQFGQLISVVGYTLLGPAPPVARLLSQQALHGLFWTDLVGMGLGTGLNMVPILPSVVSAAEQVRSLQGPSFVVPIPPRKEQNGVP